MRRSLLIVLIWRSGRNMSEEWLDIFNVEGEQIGTAARSVCHSNKGLLHRAVHVLVFNREGYLFLQKRSATKDIQPNKWDTSVGGHPGPGEEIDKAAKREAREELGITLNNLLPAYNYIWQTDIETEWIHAFAVVHEGPFQLDSDELSDGRFWAVEEIRENIGAGILSPQLEQEIERIIEWNGRVGVAAMIAKGTRHGVHTIH